MERKERRHHTREFKLEAVRLAAIGDKTKAKVARELGVRVNQLRQWRLDLEDEERNGVPKQELATAEQDLGALRRENARLREENELLKNVWSAPGFASFDLFEQKSVCVNVFGLLAQRSAAGLD